VGGANQIALGGSHEGPFTLPGGMPVAHGGGVDGFLWTLTPAGAGVFALDLRGDNPGPDDQVVTGVVFDGAGVIVGGYFSGKLTFASGTTVTSLGGSDGFVARYDGAGALVWSHAFASAGNERVLAIALDPSGNVVVGGTYTGTPTYGDAPLPGHGPGTADCFVLKLDGDGDVMPSGSWPIRSWGSTDNDLITAVAVDANGKVVVAGDYTKTMGFDKVSLPTLENSSSTVDGYLVRLDAAGAYEPPVGFNGPGDQHVHKVVTSGQGTIHVVGTFTGSMSVGPLVVQNQDATADLFAIQLNASAQVVWAVPIPNVNVQGSLALGATADGGLVLAGGYSGAADFLSGMSFIAAGVDPFVLRLDSVGGYVKHRVWSAPGTQLVTALAVDAAGAIVLGGQLAEPIDFGTGGPLAVTGPFDVFLLRMPLSSL
jgi:hypothetical protein